MRRISALFVVVGFISFPLHGVIDLLAPIDLAAIQKDLKEIHSPTLPAAGSPRPDAYKLKQQSTLLVAKVDEKESRYFTFETNEDIEQLLQTVKDSGGKQISWLGLSRAHYFERAMSFSEWADKKGK